MEKYGGTRVRGFGFEKSIEQRALWELAFPLSVEVPNEEIRQIQATLYRKLMARELDEQTIHQYKEYVTVPIVLYLCDKHWIEFGNDDAQHSKGNNSDICSWIEKWTCPCDEDDDDIFKQCSSFSLAQLAVESEDLLPVLRCLVDAGCDLEANSRYIRFPTPLTIAVRYNNVAAVKFLISKGADVNLTQIVGEYRPLWEAITMEKHEIADILLNHPGINLNLTNAKGVPLILICYEYYYDSFFEKFLKAGCDPDFTYHSFIIPTCLHLAVRNNRQEAVRLLIKHGASLDNQAPNGNTPLYDAVETGFVDIVKILLEAKSPHGLKDTTHGKPATALSHSCYVGNVDVVRVLLDYGADVNDGGTDGYLPIHWAAMSGHLDCLNALIEAGSSFDIPTKADSSTPLGMAVFKGRHNVMERLVELGSDVNHGNKFQETPLHYAVEREDINAVKMLLKHGANPNCKNEKGETSFWKCVESGNELMLEYLIQNANIVMETRASDPKHEYDDEEDDNDDEDDEDFDDDDDYDGDGDIDAFERHLQNKLILYAKFKLNEAGRKVRPKLPNAISPLFFAVQNDLPEIVDTLIKAGYNVTAEEWIADDDILEYICDDDDLKTKLRRLYGTPVSLLKTCKNFIRNCLGKDLFRNVDILPLSAALKNYLKNASAQKPEEFIETTV